MFFKYLFGIICFVSSAEIDGWFPVEKIPKAEEVMTDIDKSIWVFFSKKWGGGQFSVLLPEDPIYRTTENEFILRATSGAEVFEVAARRGVSDQFPLDSSFELDGRWIQEHVVQTGEHIFRLRTYSKAQYSPNHSAFISSFSVSS